MKYSLIITEGPHDQAVIGKILEHQGLNKFAGKLNDVDKFWTKLVPKYPAPSGDLYCRMNMPSIFNDDECSVAVHSGEGSKIIDTLKTILQNNPQFKTNLYSFGLIVDADNKTPLHTAKNYSDKLRQIFPMIPDVPGRVDTTGSLKSGIFVFPDNQNSGVVDTLVEQCAPIIYSDIHKAALPFINSVPNYHKAHWKPFDSSKALIAAIVSILKPGSANSNSLAVDAWICTSTIASVSGLSRLDQFLSQLCA